MPDIGTGLIGTYGFLTTLARPIGRLVVALRRRSGKEHPDRWTERLGQPSVPRPAGPIVWVHAASVGETVAVLPLVERIARTGVGVVLTTVTTTSAHLAGKRAPGILIHQFMPLDMAPFVNRFLDAWRPDLAVFVESEIWPIAIATLHQRGIPLVLSNGRLSERSFRGWGRFPTAARAVFGRIGLCLAQSDGDAERFRRLGVPRAESVGNIKFDAPVPEAAPAAGAALAAAVGDRPVLLAASTHDGEEALVLEALPALRAAVPGLLLMVAPRHPQRGEAVAALSARGGWSVERRSAGALPTLETDVYVADTVGELGTLYGLAPVAFVGGSLAPHGGHNPIEPARLGAAVLSGPHVDNFSEIYASMAEAGAVRIVETPHALAAAATALLVDADARGRQETAARRVVARYTGALDRTEALLEPLLRPLVAHARSTGTESAA